MVKEKFYEIRELSDEINHDYLTCYFKRDAAKKRVGDFNNGIGFFKKIQSGKYLLAREKTGEYI